MKILFSSKSFVFILFSVSFIFFSCKNNNKSTSSLDSLTDEQRHDKAHALNSLVLDEELELQVFAAEPMLVNPTNIDVDTKGRVWVCEAYNYRPDINANPTRPEGDRIVILEDTNADGKADTSKVFYQGPELASPLGIAILGNKVYVSQSPYVWIFTDENGDDKADKKEILFQGIEGKQHDHGVHTFVFGHDGKLYFNMGNEGKTLKDKNGKTVKTIDGIEINEKNFKQGLALRCDLDGNNVEVLGHNFRNNFELTQDSFGNIWQSDNDDDGNKGTRINYVMQHGNYGYTDEITGAGWRTARTNMEDSIPLKHWHLNDPGVIPNLLQTLAGSPSGITFYEGNLLPKKYQNKIIHCEPGNNVLRAYPTTKAGAGFTATIQNIAKDTTDQWFRPVDVSAAPDGSLFIADWYDPGVGGHEAGDQSRGRIYRLAPKGHKYQPQEIDVSSVAGAIAGLSGTNQATRFLAFQNLLKFGAEAEADLAKLFATGKEDYMKARAFWLLAMDKNGSKYIADAAKNSNPDLKIAAIRAAKLYKKDLLSTLAALVNDTDAQVRRECAIALHHERTPEATDLLVKLASQHNGQDRWYLEAIGIGAAGNEDAFMKAYIKANPLQAINAAQKDIIWRSRSAEALPYLTSLASNTSESLTQRLRYFRAFDFQNDLKKSDYLLKILEGNAKDQNQVNKVVLDLLTPEVVKRSSKAQEALTKVFASLGNTEDFTNLVDKYMAKDQMPRLLEQMKKMNGPGATMFSARSMLKLGGDKVISTALKSENDTTRENILESLRWVGNKQSVALLLASANDKSQPEPIRKLAYKYMGNSGEGEETVLNLLRNNKIEKPFIQAAVQGIVGSWKKAIREEARKYLGTSKASDGKELPSIVALTKMKGDATKGPAVFKAYCSTCHQIGNEGIEFGPGLSNIGSKLTSEALYTSIIHPDLGISFGYEGWDITLKDGSNVSGIISSKTETDIIMRLPGGTTQNIKTSQIKTMVQMTNSVMPAGLQESMTSQELVDLVVYLKTLK